MYRATPQKSIPLAVLPLVLILLIVLLALHGRPATGFFVGLAHVYCAEGVADRLIVLRITNAKTLFINQDQEEWNILAKTMSEIYRTRSSRTLYLSADDDVAFQTVAAAIDIVKEAKLNSILEEGSEGENPPITVKLITPAALNAQCPAPTFVTGVEP